MGTREVSIERHFTRRVRVLGGKAIKLVPASMAGLPDRIVLWPNGTITFVELKRPGKKPGKLQARTHAWLRTWGFRVLVLDGTEGIDALLTP